jgi:hypothetical protein
MMRTAVSIVIVAAVLAAAIPTRADAPPSRSAGPAAALVKLMTDQGLDAIAARDPNEPGRYIAALCFPGVQLLVVSAKYPAPAALDLILSKRAFRDVYMDLQGPAARDGRFFVQDMQADGLTARPDNHAPADIVYENGVKTLVMNGDWADQKMTEAQYDAKVDAVDQRYAAMLTTLAAALQASK